MTRTLARTIPAACVLTAFSAAARAKTPPTRPAPAHAKLVAYDAKDRRYYSLAWAKAHGMRDRGGDPLSVVPFSSLPKDANESKAMKGAKI